MRTRGVSDGCSNGLGGVHVRPFTPVFACFFISRHFTCSLYWQTSPDHTAHVNPDLHQAQPRKGVCKPSESLFSCDPQLEKLKGRIKIIVQQRAPIILLDQVNSVLLMGSYLMLTANAVWMKK